MCTHWRKSTLTVSVCQQSRRTFTHTKGTNMYRVQLRNMTKGSGHRVLRRADEQQPETKDEEHERNLNGSGRAEFGE